jgi:PAS domain S-box-containing protein
MSLSLSLSLSSILRRYVPRALGAWLALAFTLLAVVLTLAIIMVIEWKANQQVTTSIGSGLEELAMQTSDKLERGMFERYREVRLLAQRRDLQGDMPLAARRAVLDELQASYGYYSWIGIAGLDGRVQVAVHGLLEGADVSKRPWFRNAQTGVHADDVHEALLLARLLPAQAEPWRFVDIAFPVRDAAGRPQGILAAHLSWQWARDVERSMFAGIAARRQVEALIVDAGGRVLLGPASMHGVKLDLPSLRAAPTTPGGGYVEERWPDGNTYLVGFARGRGFAQYPGLGWTVLVRQNVDDAYTPVRRLREYGLSWGLLLAALFSLAGVALARYITHPLDELARSARRIQRGEHVPITSGRGNYNEVRSLGRTLNLLVDDLVGQRRQVEELNATLEQRVDQRTRALAQALDAVRANEYRIASIIETAQDAFIGVDMDGRIVDWNTAAEAMLGWRRGEVLGRLVIELVLPPAMRDQARQALGNFRATGRLNILERRLESRMLTRDGREIPVEMTTGLAGTGEGLFFSVFVHDISGRKEVERMKDEFVSTVSHELRTPLTAISASLALLADGMAGELPPDARGLVDVARASCERLMRLIGDVLDIQKIEAGNPGVAREPQALLPLAGYAVAGMQSMAAAAGVTLSCEAGPGAQELHAPVDADRITQVLTNLLSNAIKFSEPGGAVVTRIDAKDGRALVSVADQGAGIPQAFHSRVFQRFAQAYGADSRRKGGTGLGLSICKRIVEEHRGRIWFESVEGQGTTFFVELPAA